MATLFKVSKDGTVVLDRDAVKLCPGLKKLDQQETIFLILAFDYNSPFKQYPEEEKIRKAKFQVYGSIDYKHKRPGVITQCTEEYISLQYDIRRETLKLYREKIMMFSMSLLNETNARKVAEYDSTIEKLTARCDQIQKEIDTDDSISSELKAGGKKSFIEKWQENQREYKKQQDFQKNRFVQINGEDDED